MAELKEEAGLRYEGEEEDGGSRGRGGVADVQCTSSETVSVVTMALRTVALRWKIVYGVRAAMASVREVVCSFVAVVGKSCPFPLRAGFVL